MNTVIALITAELAVASLLWVVYVYPYTTYSKLHLILSALGYTAGALAAGA